MTLRNELFGQPLYRKNFMALYYDLPVFLFCAILIFIDLTKKQVGGIFKRKEMPDSVGRLHNVLLKAVQSFESLGGFTF